MEHTAVPAASDLIFVLDIGTRSIIGMVGIREDDKIRILAIEKEEHSKRAMSDGQIEDIQQVATVGRHVKERLETRIGQKLTKVCIAAAGRALKTQRAGYELQFQNQIRLDSKQISQLESGALKKAEAEFKHTYGSKSTSKFYLVGHTVVEYQVDGYPMSNLLDHKGKKASAEVVATFLPSEVVESLYTTMRLIGLEIVSMTLEPIAAMNAAIPANMRLLNLALVDIGAGTSDIAVSRDGGVIGYTMATLAGDEVTEALMKGFLVSFPVAEKIKADLALGEPIQFKDVLGLEHEISVEETEVIVSPARNALCQEIAQRIVEVNGGNAPSAVFLAGGGCKLHGMREQIASELGMDLNRVAIAGNNFEQSAISAEYVLNDSEYTTPLGIIISAGLNLISDSFRVMLNGTPVKLFRNGVLSAQELLLLNNYSIQNFLPRNGKNLNLQINGKREIIRGEPGKPAILLLNGERARLTSIIHAGDEITFTPSATGADAHLTVGDALGSTLLMASVNGKPVSPDYELQDGDVVASEEEISASAEELHSISNDILDEMYAVPPLSLINGGKSADDPSAPPSPGITIQFNGETRSFPPKADREPYYLMNLLKYADISLDHPDGDVVLLINGIPGSFLDVIHSNDQVNIFCRKRVNPD